MPERRAPKQGGDKEREAVSHHPSSLLKTLHFLEAREKQKKEAVKARGVLL